MRLLVVVLLLTSAPAASQQTDWGRYADLQRIMQPPMPRAVYVPQPVIAPVFMPLNKIPANMIAKPIAPQKDKYPRGFTVPPAPGIPRG